MLAKTSYPFDVNTCIPDVFLREIVFVYSNISDFFAESRCGVRIIHRPTTLRIYLLHKSFVFKFSAQTLRPSERPSWTSIVADQLFYAKRCFVFSCFELFSVLWFCASQLFSTRYLAWTYDALETFKCFPSHRHTRFVQSFTSDSMRCGAPGVDETLHSRACDGAWGSWWRMPTAARAGSLFDELAGRARHPSPPWRQGGEGSSASLQHGACSAFCPPLSSVAAVAVSATTARFVPTFFCSLRLPPRINQCSSKAYSAGFYHTFLSA